MFYVLLAAVLWGATNPLLKKYTEGFGGAQPTGRRKSDDPVSPPQARGAFQDILFLLRRPKYLITQVLNLLGSLAFFYGLRDTDISVASILANAATFAITCVVSAWLGEAAQWSPRKILGVALVVVGLACCTWDKRLTGASGVDANHGDVNVASEGHSDLGIHVHSDPMPAR